MVVWRILGLLFLGLLWPLVGFAQGLSAPSVPPINPLFPQNITVNGNISLGGQLILPPGTTLNWNDGTASASLATNEISAGNIGMTLTPAGTGGLTLNGPLTLPGGSVSLTNGTSNWINFNTNGYGVPTFTTRSVGTKIVLYPEITGSTTDYALGISGNTVWMSMPTNANSYYWAWYGGTTELGYMRGDGVFNALAYSVGNSTLAGVTCSGTPTASFASNNGIVIHC